MRVIQGVQAQYIGTAGTVNGNFYTGRALGVRIVPNTTGNVGNRWPRGLVIEDSARNQTIELADSSWFVIQREIIQSAYFGALGSEKADNPLAHVVGPQVKIRFNVDQVGTAASDLWDVYIAEDAIDVLTPIQPSGVTYSRDATSGLFFPTASSTGSGGASNVNVINTVQVSIAGGADAQVFDQTAGAGAAITTGALGASNLRDYVVRVSGISAPSTRTLTLQLQRSDASFVSCFVSPVLGATVTDIVFAIGLGANVPATPIGTTSLGISFPSPVSDSVQLVLSAAGTDTPRMTIWGRQNS